MSESNAARIIRVSSEMAALKGMESGSIGYRISKTTLNALTVILVNEFKDKNILVNSISPGWERTDIGGSTIPLSIEKGG
jgi:NAD(P)-dependent dehydrogenase (short-subunit alcohol dehydrogenase family)